MWHTDGRTTRKHSPLTQRHKHEGSEYHLILQPLVSLFFILFDPARKIETQYSKCRSEHFVSFCTGLQGYIWYHLWAHGDETFRSDPPICLTVKRPDMRVIHFNGNKISWTPSVEVKSPTVCSSYYLSDNPSADPDGVRHELTESEEGVTYQRD